MDAVTISALIFVIVALFSGAVNKKSTPQLAFAIIASLASYIQFGIISGLWPFTMAGIIFAVAYVVIGIAAAVEAYKEARE